MYRDLLPEEPSGAEEEPLTRGRNVIVTIGIDAYQEWPRLDNAVADARSVHELFVDTLGFVAPFEPLLDEQATREAIWELVEDRLRRYLESDDSLLLFFAGHGHPRVDRVGDRELETGYIAPVEARRVEGVRYGDLIEIEPFLDAVNRLPARHILVVLDSCYSGFALGQAVRTHRSADKYEKRLSRLVSRRVITSANQDERALDTGPIPGNSLFTGALIDGLRSRKADQDGKQFVTSSDLGNYLQRRVIEEADPEKQTPRYGVFGLDAGGEMVIAFRLEDAKKHYQLGCSLYEMGGILDDEGRFRSAIRHFGEAIRLSPQPYPVALLGRGQARLALGEFDQAVRDLGQSIKEDDSLAEAWRYMGVAQARRGEETEAARALEAYLERDPQGEWAHWAREVADQLSHRPGGSRYGLLVGIGQYQVPRMNLSGPANDVPLMRKALVERYGFAADHVMLLLDAEATREGILNALEELGQKAGVDDIVLFYYSGHSQSGDAPAYLVPHDYRGEQGADSHLISAEELHEAIRRIRARSKTLILDTHATNRFVALAREQADYTVFLATVPDRQAYEFTLSEGEKKKQFGLFTYALARQLLQLPPGTTQADVLEQTRQEMLQLQPNTKQNPLLLGSGEQPLFRERQSAELSQFDLCQRCGATALTLDQLQGQYESVRGSPPVHLPQLHYSFGRAFLEKGGYAQALAALQTAANQAGASEGKAILARGVAQLRLQRYDDALEAFQRYLEIAPDYEEQMGEPLSLLEQLGRGQKHALVVGIDVYGEHADVRGATNDALAIQRILIDAYGFQAANVRILLNEEATKQALLDSFGELVARAREEPALFYFAGAGSFDAYGAPVVVAVGETQSSGTDRLGLRELADMVGTEPTNLVAVLDAGWARSAVLPWGLAWGSRFAPPLVVSRDVRPPLREQETGQSTGSAWEPDAAWVREREQVREALAPYAIGRLSIYHASIRSTFGAVQPLGGETIVEAELEALEQGRERAVHGVMTHRLIKMLGVYARMGVKGQEEEELERDELRRLASFLWAYTQRYAESPKSENPYLDTYALLEAFFSHQLQWLQPFVLGDNLDERVFSNSVLEERVHDEIHHRIFLEPVRQVASLLQDLSEQQDGAAPEDYVDMGIAQAALGDRDQAVEILREAVERLGEPCPEAHYYLGRTLFERRQSGDLDGAAAELKAAVDQAPKDARAHYYRAETRRVQAEQDLLVEAAEAYQAYLDLGAPLGRADEVRQFLGMRQPGASR